METTKNPNLCGNCAHWYEWSEESHRDYWNDNVFSRKKWKPGDLRFGDCDKIAKGTPFDFDLDGGSHHDVTYDGYSFEDECYDEYFHCFKERD